MALVQPIGLGAEQDEPGSDIDLLRTAAGEETLGDLAGAEVTLKRLLGQRPTSASGLLALERVLRTQDRTKDVLSFAEHFVELDPKAASPRLVQLRVYAELGDDRALEDTAEGWMNEAKSSIQPYREVVTIYARALGPGPALSVLERGRTAVGRPTLFAMRAGDLLRDLGREDEAILEWANAIVDDATQVSMVIRRVGELEGKSETLVLPLLEQLASLPVTPVRLRAAARIAVEAGAFGEARTLAQRSLEGMADRPRRGFLMALARQAQEMYAPEVELWAYESLREGAADDAERRALDQRITLAALTLGDTARALAAQHAIAADLPEGNVDRQRALAETLRLGIEQDGAGMKESLKAFAREFPHAPQLDQLAVTLAVQLDAAGDREGAQVLLAGVAGPRSALERGYLYLAAGDIAEGRVALQEALSGVSAALATEVITFLDILDGLEGEPIEAFLRGAVLAHQGSTDGALAELELSIGAVSADARPPLLAMGARIADGGRMPERAASIRVRIIRDHPNSSEVAEATLGLARFKGATPDGLDDAILLLESLILNQPNSAIVPTARRELQRIQNGAQP
jgi:hypothetical protein